MILVFKGESDLEFGGILAEKARKLEPEMRQILSNAHEIGMIASRLRRHTRDQAHGAAEDADRNSPLHHLPLRRAYYAAERYDKLPRMDVEDALARLKTFRQLWHDGDVIDQDSGLTAADLDVMIEWMDEARSGPAQPCLRP